MASSRGVHTSFTYEFWSIMGRILCCVLRSGFDRFTDNLVGARSKCPTIIACAMGFEQRVGALADAECHVTLLTSPAWRAQDAQTEEGVGLSKKLPYSTLRYIALIHYLCDAAEELRSTGPCTAQLFERALAAAAQGVLYSS